MKHSFGELQSQTPLEEPILVVDSLKPAAISSVMSVEP